MIVARDNQSVGAVARAHRADAAFRAFVDDGGFPCLAGKGVVHADRYALAAYGELGSARSARRLARDLTEFLDAAPAVGSPFRAFVAVHAGRGRATEEEFERRLWMTLQQLHDGDDPATGWDPIASADPDEPDFAFSLTGRALFVIGLHPGSSRLARRFRWPTLVFNPHEQFDRLRADGRFDRLRNAVREREIALQGSLNPNLADFGEQSEARQYSGRAVEPEWRCPFHHRDR
jgi:FPC/CPF motif-containing protein YcgG